MHTKTYKAWGKRILGFTLSLLLLAGAASVPAVAEEAAVHQWNTAADAGWDLVASGDTIQLGAGFTGELVIPDTIKSLTLDGQGHGLSEANIVAEGAVELTVRDLHVTASTGKHALCLAGMGSSMLRIEGECGFTGGDPEGNLSCSGIYAAKNVIPVVSVPEGASLTARGGDAVIPVSSERFLGGIGICAYGLALQNDGQVLAESGRANGAFGSSGIQAYAPSSDTSQPGLTVSGSGHLLCRGYAGITAYQSPQGSEGSLLVQRCRVVALGTGRFGIISNHGAITGEDGASLAALGPLAGMDCMQITSVYSDLNAFAVPAEALAGKAIDDRDGSQGLDLTDAGESTLFTNLGGGIALWEPASGETPRHRLTLQIAAIRAGGLTLPAGHTELCFQDYAVIRDGVRFPEENAAESVRHPAGNSLSLIAGDSASELTVVHSQGRPFTGVDSVEFSAAQSGEEGYLAAETASDPDGRGFRGIPGSVFPLSETGCYRPRETDRRFHLWCRASLHDNNFALTVQNGTGGGLYDKINGLPLDPVPIEYEPSGPTKRFAGWILDEGEESSVADPESPSTTVTLLAQRTVVRAREEELPGPAPAPMPGPSLETGTHTAYLRGGRDGTLRPEADLTREEAAQIFYNLLDEASRERYETTACPFPDVDGTGWAFRAVSTLWNAGILKGGPDGTFRPSGKVTRAEFAALAARFDPGTYAGDDLFPDTAGHWARESINYAADKGWVRGYPDGTFRPNASITRAEAATLINHVLERAPETADDLLPGRTVFRDNADPRAWYYLALEEAANSHEYRRKSTSGSSECWTSLG